MVPHVLRSDRIRTEARSSWGRACPPVVGMLGRFDLKENLHVFLGMARIVNARRPEARFLIASAIGPGEHPDRSYADSLGHLVKSYGLEDRVSFRARPNDLNDFKMI